MSARLHEITQENHELREIMQHVLVQRQLELAAAAEQSHADADSVPLENDGAEGWGGKWGADAVCLSVARAVGHPGAHGLPSGVGVEESSVSDVAGKPRVEDRGAEDEDEEKCEAHAVMVKLVEQNAMLQAKVEDLQAQLLPVNRALTERVGMPPHERTASSAAIENEHGSAYMLDNAAQPQLPVQNEGAAGCKDLGTIGDAREGGAENDVRRAPDRVVQEVGVAEAHAALMSMRHEQEQLAGEREHLMQAVVVRERALRYNTVPTTTFSPPVLESLLGASGLGGQSVRMCMCRH